MINIESTVNTALANLTTDTLCASDIVGKIRAGLRLTEQEIALERLAHLAYVQGLPANPEGTGVGSIDWLVGYGCIANVGGTLEF